MLQTGVAFSVSISLTTRAGVSSEATVAKIINAGTCVRSMRSHQQGWLTVWHGYLVECSTAKARFTKSTLISPPCGAKRQLLQVKTEPVAVGRGSV